MRRSRKARREVELVSFGVLVSALPNLVVRVVLVSCLGAVRE